MSVVYVTRPGSQLKKQGGRLKIYHNGQLLSEVPLANVERILILAPAQITAVLTYYLVQNNIPVLYHFADESTCSMLSRGNGNVEYWLAQTSCWQDALYRLQTCAQLVRRKLANQEQLLRRAARNYGDPTLREAADKIVEMGGEAACPLSLQQLRGIEGQGARVYFGVFARCIRRPGFEFNGRTRRPPRDAVNALLSLGYMLLLGEVVWTLQASGLHPGLGFLHEPSRRSQALALDLIEIYRQPIVDRLVLSSINLGVIKPEDFYVSENYGIRLKKPAFIKYLGLFEERLGTVEGEEKSYRRRMYDDVDELKKSLQEGTIWHPPSFDF